MVFGNSFQVLDPNDSNFIDKVIGDELDSVS
jgi:hypothetical protein